MWVNIFYVIWLLTIENFQEEFISRMNFPYGRMPISRLRQIHGVDDNDDHHDQQPLY